MLLCAVAIAIAYDTFFYEGVKQFKDSEIVNLDKLFSEFKKGLLSVTKTEKAKRIKTVSQTLAQFNVGSKNVASATPKDEKKVANKK